jgi:hypothetical protein
VICKYISPPTNTILLEAVYPSFEDQDTGSPGEEVSEKDRVLVEDAKEIV